MRLREQLLSGPEEVQVGQTIGTYRIVREIGRGGMGVVYEAVHESIGQRAAIKVLSAQLASESDFGNRLLNEARAISMVRHPGLVNIFDFNRLPGGTVFIMMEYLEGESLWQRYTRLRQDGVLGAWLSLNESVQIARQIASTLAAVHRKSIVHRDLKPENIMLVDDPEMPLGQRAKLLDFGIAKLRSSTAMTEEAVRRTDVGIVLGTPVYMSPEQFLEEELDGQSDVYSLGAMIYEMVARRPPFTGKKWGELALKHLHEAPVPLSQIPVDVPEELDALVMDMLAKDLHDRPVMAQVVDRLDELAEFLRTGSRPAGGKTEMFCKVDPEDFAALPVQEVAPARPAVPVRLERRPTPAHGTRSSVRRVPPAARNEARMIRWVTVALGLVTAVFLLGVYLFADRPPSTPPVQAHIDPMAPIALTTPVVVTPSTTPLAEPGSELAQAPSEVKSQHPRGVVAPRFARRR